MSSVTKVLTIVSGIPTITSVQMTLPAIYDQTTSLVADITAGTSVTLPASQTYDSAELEVWRNGVRLIASTHYSYIGSVPRTQVSFVSDLKSGDNITFRIYRNV